MGSGFEKTLGTLLVGIFLNTYLYGIVTYQFAAYYHTKFNDPLWIKATVLVLFVTDTFHSAAVIYMAWEYCVTNFTNPTIVGVALWPYTFTPIGTAIAAVVTHNFLGYRIYRLTRNKYIYGIIVFFALFAFALGVACGTKAWIIKTSSELLVLQPLVTLWLAVQTAIDLVIAGLMARLLYRSRTGFRNTDTVIKRLIRGAIQTGCFAAIFVMGDLIAFLVSTDSNLYGMFAIPLGRIYTNTLMDTLIVRSGLKDLLNGAVDLGDPHTHNIWGESIISRTPATTSNIELSQISMRRDIHTERLGDNKKAQVSQVESALVFARHNGTEKQINDPEDTA
ncbi:hypothetical protein Hypma_014087 [Hypsizygus marmoreus]|uniref:DUF6534 domain-containing protein n=1 Tax=Hypsizygus marmoreus TaxID=39966 RepID=A0A369KDS6_HYPMA|nr:hypothetical protein Hypma_014087 [Hypsizygus marmoreus]